MQIKRTAALTAVACLALGGLAACGDGGSGISGPGATGLTGAAGSDAGKGNGVEKLTAKQIRDRAQSALNAAKSVHVVIDSKEVDIDMTVNHAGDCKGTFSPEGTQADFVKTGGASYVKGDRAFWSEMSPDEADTIDGAAAGRYLKSTGSDTDVGVDDSLCDLNGALTPADDADGSGDTLAKGGVSTVHGVRCVEVTAKDSDGTAHIYAATSGKPYPVSMTGESDGEQIFVTLSDYDKQVSIGAPPDSQVVDASQVLD